VQIKAIKNDNVYNKGQSVKLVMRPENIYLSRNKRDEWLVNSWQGDVVVPNYLGTQTRYVISLNSRRLFVTILGSTQAFQADDKVYVYIPPEEIQILED